jgi:hypothetical protein
MTLYEKIIAIYPELSTYDFAFGAICLENASDGKGDYIAKWKHPDFAQPTQAELNAV